jgi:peptidoglycan/xylan/chitin deacetylase (PgdA/CDA1 family)
MIGQRGESHGPAECQHRLLSTRWTTQHQSPIILPPPPPYPTLPQSSSLQTLVKDAAPISIPSRIPMRLGVGAFVRRARRFAFTSRLPLYNAPTKHIKIDDEEQQGTPANLPSPFLRAMKTPLLALFLLLLLVLLLAYTVYKPSTFVIRFLQWKYPDVLFQVPVPVTQKIVALTLDDAPSGETTKILDLLKLYGAKATFFVIGSQIASHPGILQRIRDEGHEIGNHAWRDEPSISLPISELERQIKEVEALLPANTDGAKYFRPGSGFFNKKLIQRAKSLGYKIVLGSIYPHDPQIHNAKVNARHVLSLLKPGRIIIMHDRRSYSAEQLELVLKGLADKSWNVESLGGLLRIAETYGGKKAG